MQPIYYFPLKEGNITNNTGDFLLSAGSDQTSIIEYLHHYFSRRNGEKYMDICAFHGEDTDVSNILRCKETGTL